MSYGGAPVDVPRLMQGLLIVRWKSPDGAFKNMGSAAMLPPPSVPIVAFHPPPLPPQPDMSQ